MNTNPQWVLTPRGKKEKKSVVAKLTTLQLQKTNNIAVTKKITTLQLRKTNHSAVKKLVQLWLKKPDTLQLQRTNHTAITFKKLFALQL